MFGGRANPKTVTDDHGQGARFHHRVQRKIPALLYQCGAWHSGEYCELLTNALATASGLALTNVTRIAVPTGENLEAQKSSLSFMNTLFVHDHTSVQNTVA